MLLMTSLGENYLNQKGSLVFCWVSKCLKEFTD